MTTVFQRVTGGRYGETVSALDIPPGFLRFSSNTWRRAREQLTWRGRDFPAPNTFGATNGGEAREFFIGQNAARADPGTLYFETNFGEVVRADAPGPTFTLLSAALGDYAGNGERGSFFQGPVGWYYCGAVDLRFSGGAVRQPTSAFADGARYAGMPRCLDARLFAAGDLLGAAGWLANGYQAAYRYVLRFTDADGLVHQSEPSGRDLVTNAAGGARDVARRVWLHPEAVAGWVLEVYRTLSVPNGVSPSANYYKAQEYTLVAGDITNAYAVINDRTPDAVLSDEPLYTNPSDGDGELAAKGRPPTAIKGSAWWDGRAWYAGNGQPQRFIQCRLLGVGAPDGLQDNDLITINGQALRAKLVPALATDFQLYATGTASQNIEQTTKAMLDVAVNNATIRAGMLGWYISSPDDAGLFELRDRFATFPSCSVSRATAWAIGVPPARYTWGLWFSDVGEPESVRFTSEVPLVQQPRHVLALGGSLFVFLDPFGLVRVREGEPYAAETIDPHLALYSKVAIVHEGAIWAWTNKGLVRITEDGSVDPSVGVGFRAALPTPTAPMSLINNSYFLVSVPAQHRLELWSGGTSGYALNTETGEWHSWSTDGAATLVGGIAWSCHPTSGASRTIGSACIYGIGGRALWLERTAQNASAGANNVSMTVYASLMPPVPQPGKRRRWRRCLFHGDFPVYAGGIGTSFRFSNRYATATEGKTEANSPASSQDQHCARDVPLEVADQEALQAEVRVVTPGDVNTLTDTFWFRGITYSFEDISEVVPSTP